MRLIVITPGQIGCCGCSKTVPVDDPVAVCRCCGRFYCTRCYETALAFLSENRERVDAALGGPRDSYCMEEVLAELEKALLEELLNSIPVPPRDQGH
jgi:hypothetical protein